MTSPATPSRPTFPHCFDSTMLATFRSCPQKCFRSYVEHWKPRNESVHLVAGKAFATGIEVARRVYFEGQAPVMRQIDGQMRLAEWAECEAGNRELAEQLGVSACIFAYGDFECPPESAKSLERTAGALEYYFDQYKLGDDGMIPVSFPSGRKAIEFSFAEPLPINHPVSGNPILYTGRCDMIAEFANGVYTVDEKTTSQLGQSWGRQWEMRGQFTGYQWAAGRAGIAVQGTIVRGVSILKTKYDTLQIPTYRSQHEVDRWLEQTVRDIARAQRMWEEGYWDYALDHACAEYGGCSMVRVCKSAEPESWLAVDFVQRPWDPLARREVTMEEFNASWGD